MELEIIKKIIAEILGADAKDISDNTYLKEDLGADSLELYRIALALEDKFEINLPEGEYLKINSAAGALKAVREA